MTPYADDFAASVSAAYSGQVTVPLGRGIPTTVRELVDALNRLAPDAEVFIDIDPAVIHDAVTNGDTSDLASATRSMYPVAVRVDTDGDAIIHVTDSERGNQ